MPKLTGLVVGGKLPTSVWQDAMKAVGELDGKRVVITIKEQAKPRSLKQNSFYQGPFIEAFQACLLQTGHRVSCEDIHAGLRDAYAKNGYLIDLGDGLTFRIPPSTTRLSTSGFEDFLMEIRAKFAAEPFCWQLPHPNEEQYHE